MEMWFCSDHHLWHENIIGYTGRPFSNAEEMNEALLESHNELVKPQDHVYFLGDMTMLRNGRDKERFIQEVRKYNGHKRLFLGNHDHFSIKTYLDAGFEKIYATWRTEDNIIFSHIPIHPQSLGSVIANVHGHIHEAPEYEPAFVNDRCIPYINVSMENIDYKPINREELLIRIKYKQAAHFMKIREQ
jgi:calcineurin-like phosphoesterase family protein